MNNIKSKNPKVQRSKKQTKNKKQISKKSTKFGDPNMYALGEGGGGGGSRGVTKVSPPNN